MTYQDKEDLVATMRSRKICVVIPTYNNAGTLRHVISGVLEYASDLLVVNDGSTDETARILESLGPSITVIGYPDNRGKGHALKTAFRRALELGYDYAVTLDSDGQHDPADIPSLVRAVIEHPDSLVVGERDLSRVDIDGRSSFANQFSNFWFCIQTGKKLKDTQTGYRAYPLKKLRGLSLLTSRYEAELELLVLAAWHGVPIRSIPIRVYYPPRAERVSHFRPALDFTRISLLNTVLCGGAIVYGIPVRLWNTRKDRRWFRGEFKLFTRKHGERKEAATTFGRLARSFYGIAYFVFWALGVFTPFACLYFSIGKNTENKKFRFHRMLQRISSFLTRRFPGARTTYENPANETFDEPALIVCNHQSHLDLPVLLSIHPKLVFLTNDWVWNNLFYGRIIHHAEFLPVSAGLDVILPQLRDLKERGYSIVVFPEGTRSADCSILRFHQGAFMLARQLQLDIVPMVLHGAGHYLPKKDFMFRKGEITLKILPRIPGDRYAGLALREQASVFRKMIRNEYREIAGRKETPEYFRSLVLYKYAYRGWPVVSRCKETLRTAVQFHDLIRSGHSCKKVRIIHSGIGTFALLYALVNKETEVHAYESAVADFAIASATASVPENLHYRHAVWESDFEPDNDWDLTLILNSAPESAATDNRTTLRLPLRS